MRPIDRGHEWNAPAAGADCGYFSPRTVRLFCLIFECIGFSNCNLLFHNDFIFRPQKTPIRSSPNESACIFARVLLPLKPGRGAAATPGCNPGHV
ncbi:MAG TPA: hypothetical protein VLT92_15005, partial [Burkholderiales bacterium]|nr:hypothetical protein [Burkholderiales bacterium]